MLVKVKKMYEDAQIPRRASAGAVGFDVYAYHVLHKGDREFHSNLPAEIPAGSSILIGIGVQMAVPVKVDCEVRPRSGLANKFDIELSNSPGTIDPDYRGEASILLRNRGHKSFTVEKGQRIAQLIFKEVEIPKLEEVDVLPPTSRGTGGFGSTGLKEIVLGDEEYAQEQLKWDKHFMRMAISAAGLSDCLRGATQENGVYLKDSMGFYVGSLRRFGCVIVVGKNVVAQGFNYRNTECSEEFGCIREKENIRSGTANDRGCYHAEESAIQNYTNSGGPPLKGATVYVNAEPYLKCSKFLSRTGISTVVVPQNVYPENGLRFLMEEGVEVRRISLV